MDARPAYIEHLLGYVDQAALRPLKIVVNAGNGAAGPAIDALEGSLPFQLIKVHHEPDGSYLIHDVPVPASGEPIDVFFTASHPDRREITKPATLAADTETGEIWSASNPLGQRSPAITDTMAFATCP